MNIGLRKRTFAFRAAALGGCGIVALSPLTTAQTAPPVLQTLPPPPAVPLPNPPPTPNWPTEPLTEPSQTRPNLEPASINPQTKPTVEQTSNTPPTSSKPGEIDWRASQGNIPLLRTSQSQIYRVEVYGASELLLTRVRQIAPQAFIRPREGVIQVGVFEEQQRAEELVQKLVMESLWSRIVIVSSYAKSGE